MDGRRFLPFFSSAQYSLQSPVGAGKDKKLQLGYNQDEIAEGVKALADPFEQLVELADNRKISLK